MKGLSFEKMIAVYGDDAYIKVIDMAMVASNLGDDDYAVELYELAARIKEENKNGLGNGTHRKAKEQGNGKISPERRIDEGEN